MTFCFFVCISLTICIFATKKDEIWEIQTTELSLTIEVSDTRAIPTLHNVFMTLQLGLNLIGNKIGLE